MPTTTVKSIGTSSRDYSTISTWEAGAAANLVTADEVWKGECYNDSAFSEAVTISGSTTDATRYKWLTAASGQSFADHANKTTNGLRYNTSNGAGVSQNTSGVETMTVGEANFKLTRMQVQTASVIGAGRAAAIAPGATGLTVEGCILESLFDHVVRVTSYAPVMLYKNCLLIQRTGSSTTTMGMLLGTPGSGTQITSCTIVRPSDLTHTTSIGISPGVASRVRVRNNAVFGFDTCFSSGSYATGSDYNATDLSSTGCSGANDVVSLTYSSQFETTTDASRDFRAKSSGGLPAEGTADLTLDILEQTRASPPYIGAHEVVGGGGGRTTKNTRAASLGYAIGYDWRHG